MDRRKKIIIIVILVIIGILLAIFFLVGQQKNGNEQSTPTATTTTPQGERASLTPPVRERTQSEVKEMNQESQVLAIARTFAERYGSFSNQGGFLNLLDLEAISTDSLNRELRQSYVDREKEEVGEYFGVTTRVVSLKVEAIDSDSSARVRAETQREEARGNTTSKRVYYQAITLELVKVGNVWKVDSVKWE